MTKGREKRSPVVCWNSNWIKTGKVETIRLENGSKLQRTLRRLVFEYNKDWKPKIKIDK
tara:strand:+ start:1295 stop:1471 length:177 start_codon:yes stop_codon:yes gene_type:complete